MGCVPGILPDGVIHEVIHEVVRGVVRGVAHEELPVAELCLRARAEYIEMPGLRLTLAQAARLFDLERALCAQTLDTLVDAGFLQRTGMTYFRADTGRRSV